MVEMGRYLAQNNISVEQVHTISLTLPALSDIAYLVS